MAGDIDAELYDEPGFRELSDVARLVCCYFISFAKETPEDMRACADELTMTTGLHPEMVAIAIEEIISSGGEKLICRYKNSSAGTD